MGSVSPSTATSSLYTLMSSPLLWARQNPTRPRPFSLQSSIIWWISCWASSKSLRASEPAVPKDHEFSGFPWILPLRLAVHPLFALLEASYFYSSFQDMRPFVMRLLWQVFTGLLKDIIFWYWSFAVDVFLSTCPVSLHFWGSAARAQTSQVFS